MLIKHAMVVLRLHKVRQQVPHIRVVVDDGEALHLMRVKPALDLHPAVSASRLLRIQGLAHSYRSCWQAPNVQHDRIVTRCRMKRIGCTLKRRIVHGFNAEQAPAHVVPLKPTEPAPYAR